VGGNGLVARVDRRWRGRSKSELGSRAEREMRASFPEWEERARDGWIVKQGVGSDGPKGDRRSPSPLTLQPWPRRHEFCRISIGGRSNKRGK